MKTLLKYLTFLSVSLIFFLPALSYGDNSRFYNTYSVNTKTGDCPTQLWTLTIGDDANRMGEDGYLYVPAKGNYFINKGTDEDYNLITETIAIKGREIYWSRFTQSVSDLNDNWTKILRFTLSENYKVGAIEGYSIDYNPSVCQEGISGGITKRKKKFAFSQSFSPVTALNGFEDPVTLSWRYRVMNQPIKINQVVNGVSLRMSFRFKDIILTIDPSALERKAALKGSVNGSARGISFTGNFNAGVTENIQLSAGKTLVDNEEMNMNIILTAMGESANIKVNANIDFDTPAEWFLDRSDLDMRPIGYIYDEQGIVGASVNGYVKVKIPGEGPSTQNFSDYVSSPESWEIVDWKDSMVVMGKEYFNIVVVDRRTIIPDYADPYGNQNVTIRYWVAQGVGMIRGEGQFSFGGNPLVIELVSTNLQQ
ncbi:MAG: hypothetical protein HZB30_03100 [Nitrospirae bacterium]|nr:hypothetical protein [Nitrospirota bacterium]